MTDAQLKVIKGEEAPKKNCSNTIPFNEVYPERREVWEDKKLQGTNITSGRHKSQCSEVTFNRDYGFGKGPTPSTFINLGCKSVN